LFWGFWIASRSETTFSVFMKALITPFPLPPPFSPFMHQLGRTAFFFPIFVGLSSSGCLLFPLPFSPPPPPPPHHFLSFSLVLFGSNHLTRPSSRFLVTLPRFLIRMLRQIDHSAHLTPVYFSLALGRVFPGPQADVGTL